MTSEHRGATAPPRRADPPTSPTTPASDQTPAPAPGALYRDHGPRLRRVAAHVLGDEATRDEVSDILNGVFDELVRLLGDGQLDDVRDWRAYLIAMTRHAAIARGKTLADDRTRLQPLEPDGTADTDYSAGAETTDSVEAGAGGETDAVHLRYATGPDPTGEAVVARLVTDPARRETHRQLDEAFTALDRRAQRIIEGRYRDRMTNQALGDELGITGQRVSQLHEQALRRLREVTTRR